MGTIQSGIEYLTKRHEEKAAERAERRKEAEARREEQRQQREAEHKETLAKLTERFQKQFGWSLSITDYGYDEWGDPVYRLDTGNYITLSERDPTLYRRKPKEDPFKDIRETWREERIKEEIRADVLRDIRAQTASQNGS